MGYSDAVVDVGDHDGFVLNDAERIFISDEMVSVDKVVLVQSPLDCLAYRVDVGHDVFLLQVLIGFLDA